MRITSLELENVKSYVRQRIEFTNGLNAICGLNGSGKSTVLEAIGFALFDYLPYSQSSFIRERERAATIRVRFSAHDGREYEVVRRIGGGGAYYVADIESGTRLAERTQNVVDWIRTQALGIDGSADLSALFKNAVGVPQGLITADFIQNSGTARKTIFDPLLRVEEYRNAYEYLRETSSFLTGLTGTVREEIARLETETEGIPQLRERIDELTGEIAYIDQRRAQLAIELGTAGAQKDELDAALELCRQVTEQLRAARYDETRFAERQEIENRALDQSMKAQEIVHQSEPGYQVFLAAREQLRSLEQDRTTRDELNAQSAAVTSRLSAINGRIDGLQSQWDAARSAAAEAALLHDPARRQEQLSAELTGVLRQIEERDALASQAAKIQEEMTAMRSEMDARDRRLRESQVARNEIGRLDSVQRELESTRDALARLEPLKRQVTTLMSDGQRLRRLVDEIDRDLEQHRELQALADERKAQAAPMESLIARQDEMREERVRVIATLEYQNIARGELRNHHCPLLDLTCPAVEADGSLLDRFDGRVTDLNSRAGCLEAELAKILPALEVARRAAEEARDLELKAARLGGRSAQRDAAHADLARCREEYSELFARVKGEADLVDTCERLTAEHGRLQELVPIAALLSELQDRQEKDGRRFDELNESMRGLEFRRLELRDIDTHKLSLERELEELGDPRRRRDDLLAIAGRLPELEKEQREQHVLLADQQDRLKAVIAQMQRYLALDTALDEQHRLEAVHADDHDRYLAHRDEAGKQEERRVAVREATQHLEEARRSVLALETQLAQSASAYDRDRHEQVRDLHRLLGEEISAANAKHTYVVNDLQGCERDLVQLQRQQKKLEERQAERDELGRVSVAVGFIRETLKAAGPVITETLLTNISQTANDIYAEIMNDHAADLRWARDYEVIVQRGAEERRFVQLSGGEQMSAALAVRLALLKEMSDIDFAFFDEPTQNMDGERRENLAEQIRAVRGFEQLIVISHDDTFEHHTDNLIRLRKIHEETEMEPD